MKIDYMIDYGILYIECFFFLTTIMYIYIHIYKYLSKMNIMRLSYYLLSACVLVSPLYYYKPSVNKYKVKYIN